MKAKIGGFVAIAIGILVAIGVFASDTQIENSKNVVFHVTLADPQKFEDGTFTDSFEITEGTYEFRFVPNGDSPKNLTITLRGQSLNFIENFILEGTPHETGVSTYYTWKYNGEKNIHVLESQAIEILIDPNGNLLGPVSVDIISI